METASHTPEETEALAAELAARLGLGDLVTVSGEHGSGQTTFVRALATLLRLDDGSRRVLGHDVRREPETVRRLLGLAGQSAAVEPAMTGRENLEMVARLLRSAPEDRTLERTRRPRPGVG